MPWLELDRYQWSKLLRLAKYLPRFRRLTIVWRYAEADRRRVEEKKR